MKLLLCSRMKGASRMRAKFLVLLLLTTGFSGDYGTILWWSRAESRSHLVAFATPAIADEERQLGDTVVEVDSKNSSNNADPDASLNWILRRAAKRAFGGGMTGAIAGLIQVFTLMWVRTVINYQCRYGTTFQQAMRTLLNDGGIPRLYRGLPFAIFQTPLSRFGSTAANDGVALLLASFTWSGGWGPSMTTAVASIAVGLWRMFLMPIDTMKTVLQVDSTEGFNSLIQRVKAGHFGVLYSGAIANAFAASLGHYPWFYTYNLLSSKRWVEHLLPWKHFRNGALAIVASLVSDTCVNAIRVVKTTKQAVGSKRSLSYLETIRVILAADGWRGLLGRGLRTRILANALQSVVFTIIWRWLEERWAENDGTKVS